MVNKIFQMRRLTKKRKKKTMPISKYNDPSSIDIFLEFQKAQKRLENSPLDQLKKARSA